MTLITPPEAQRISATITEAEARTSGEIVAVVTAESSSYLYAPFMWAALTALLVPWPLVYFTWWPIQWIYLLQLAVFAGLLAIFLMRPIRYWLVPPSIKRLRAHRRAVEQFLVQNLHTTEGRTGVLIFVSEAERYAEILADAGIHSRVAGDVWKGAVEELTRNISAGRAADGFVAAIKTVGSVLEKHFPPGSEEPKRLPNHLIVLQGS